MSEKGFSLVDAIVWILWMSVLCLTALILFSNEIHAQERYFKNEVIIEPKADFISMAELNGFFPQFVKQDGYYKFVPRGQTVNLLETRVLVDAKDNPCKHVPKDKFFCDPNYLVKAYQTDPRIGELWGLDNSKARAGWGLVQTKGYVAVIDSGVDPNHPDLDVDVEKSRDIACPACAHRDDNGHGTHVAGTIGAVVNNGLGVAGVSDNVKIISSKIFGKSGGGSLSDAIKGVRYITDLKLSGVNILVANMSWGGRGKSEILNREIQRGIESGIFYAVAAGNDGEDITKHYHFPASFVTQGMASVASITRHDDISGFSNYGRIVSLAAPGSDILSTWPKGGYNSISGTSMASPHVAGAAYVVRAVTGSTSRETKKLLEESVRTLPSLSGKIKTGGTLDVARLLGAQAQPTPEPTPTEKCVKTFKFPRNGKWPAGSKWKIPADNGGTVMITPENVPDCTQAVVERGETVIETMEFTGRANGNRAHYRARSKGVGDWPTECRIRFKCKLPSGSLCWKMPNGNKTWEGR